MSDAMSVAGLAEDGSWLHRLRKLEELIAIAYAVSLPLSMSLSWGLLIAAVVCVAIDLVASEESRQAIFRAAPQAVPLAVPLLGLVVAVALSGLCNGGIAEAWRSVWSLKGISIYFAASLFFFRSSTLGSCCLTYLLTTSAVAGVWGAVQQIFNFHPFGYRYLQGTGFLSGPMAFAGQMEMFGMVAAALLLTKGYAGLKRPLSGGAVFAMVAIANLLGILFAGERSAWLGALSGMLAAAALLSWRTFIKGAAVLGLLGVISFFTVPLVHTRVEGLFSGQQDVSTRVRLQVWQAAVDEWHKSPVVGVGFLHFPHLDIPEAIVPGKSKDLNHAHSNYLQFLSTTGLLGLAAYGWLLLATLWTAVKKMKLARQQGDEFSAGTAIGLFAASISLAVAGIFEYNFGTAQVRLAQWFLLGLLSGGRGDASATLDHQANS